MRFCRFLEKASAEKQTNAERYGVLGEQQIQEISGPPWREWSETRRAWRLDDVRLLAPVEPTKIVCVGRNYAAHAAELGNEVPTEPLIFLKPPSAIIGPGEAIVLPTQSHKVEHEGELGLVVGRRCSRLKAGDEALSYLLGYTCINDVTARDLQKSDVQFTRGKGFDTFCPVGPHIETQLNPADVLVETHVNDLLRQSSRTSLMIYPVAFLVRWISNVMTLFPGDLIATGTPAGVGPLVVGDSVAVGISGVGVLRNRVEASDS